MKKFDTALVTGASSGIGRAFARALARKGTNLVLVARRRDRLERVATEIGTQSGVKVMVVPLDLSRQGSAVELFETVTGQGHEIDLLVNNAGFGLFGNFAEQDREKIVEMITLNVTTLTELCHLFLAGMRERRRGAIINVSSAGGFFSVPTFAVYTATKAYVTSFSEALSVELAPEGIAVMALCPGTTTTEFATVAGMGGSKDLPGLAMSPEKVVQIALSSLRRRKTTVIPGFSNRLAVWSHRLVPRAWMPWIAKFALKHF